MKTIIGLTGLHGCGKSFLSKIMEDNFGWIHVNKRRYLEKIFDRKFESNDSLDSIEWYRNLYKTEGVSNLMTIILNNIPDNDIIILDAIHNPMEGGVVKRNIEAKKILVGVFSPKSIRDSRNSELDAILDLKRVNYWHQESQEYKGTRCLMSEVEWVFNGVSDEENQLLQIQKMVQFMDI
jgi:hypothetical protein